MQPTETAKYIAKLEETVRNVTDLIHELENPKMGEASPVAKAFAAELRNAVTVTLI